MKCDRNGARAGEADPSHPSLLAHSLTHWLSNLHAWNINRFLLDLDRVFVSFNGFKIVVKVFINI